MSGFGKNVSTTITVSWGGPFANVNGDIEYTQIGNSVTMKLPEIIQYNDETLSPIISTALPQRLRPATGKTVFKHIIVNDGDGGYHMGSMKIDDTGVINIDPDLDPDVTANFDFGQLVGFPSQHVSYISESVVNEDFQ